MLLMKAERSTSAREHFYTLPLELKLAQLEGAQKTAKVFINQDIEQKAEEQRLAKERLRLKVGSWRSFD